MPPGARELARAEGVPLAFVQGTSVGVQFHPEVDARLAEEWIESWRRTLLEHAVDDGTLRDQVRLAAPGAPARALDLFDRIARLWSGRPAARAPDSRARGIGRRPGLLFIRR